MDNNNSKTHISAVHVALIRQIQLHNQHVRLNEKHGWLRWSTIQLRQVPRLTSCGSQAGDQCLLKGVIFLFGLSQFRIGYGWASMAHIWNSTHLRKPLSTAQPSIHPLSALLVLILGRLQFASSSPPISLRLQFRCASIFHHWFLSSIETIFLVLFSRKGRVTRERGGESLGGEKWNWKLNEVVLSLPRDLRSLGSRQGWRMGRYCANG